MKPNYSHLGCPSVYPAYSAPMANARPPSQADTKKTPSKSDFFNNLWQQLISPTV